MTGTGLPSARTDIHSSQLDPDIQQDDIPYENEESSEADVRRRLKETSQPGIGLWTEETVNLHYDSMDKEPGLWEQFQNHMKRSMQRFSLSEFLLSFFPVVRMIRANGYPLENFQRDVIVGLTLAAVIIPQSLAYALLCNLPAEYGLYAAFFAPLLYSVLGSSKELSSGPFALVSLVMVQQVAGIAPHLNDIVYEVAMRQAFVPYVLYLSFVGGLWLLIFSFFRLGWISSLFSAPTISGFITASSSMIITTQIASLLQIKTRVDDNFITTWGTIFNNLRDTNIASAIIGAVCVVGLVLIDVWASKKNFKFPLPTQIVLIIFTTLLCWLLRLDQKWSLKIVGEIKQGFINPLIPAIPNDGYNISFTDFILPGLSLAIVAYVICISVSKTMASKNDYRIEPNQEMFALAVISVIGSFFACHLSAGSLSRSALADSLKAATPLWNAITAAIVALCLLALAPWLFYLPNGILAAIIIAAFRSLLTSFGEPLRLWKRSPAESLFWVIVFVITLVVSTQVGLIAAAILSLGKIIYDTARPSFCREGNLPGTILYRDVRRYPSAREFNDLLVFRFDSSLHFANFEFFLAALTKEVERKLDVQRAYLKQLELNETGIEADNLNQTCAPNCPAFIRESLALSRSPTATGATRKHDFDEKSSQRTPVLPSNVEEVEMTRLGLKRDASAVSTVGTVSMIGKSGKIPTDRTGISVPTPSSLLGSSVISRAYHDELRDVLPYSPVAVTKTTSGQDLPLTTDALEMPQPSIRDAAVVSPGHPAVTHRRGRSRSRSRSRSQAVNNDISGDVSPAVSPSSSSSTSQAIGLSLCTTGEDLPTPITSKGDLRSPSLISIPAVANEPTRRFPENDSDVALDVDADRTSSSSTFTSVLQHTHATAPQIRGEGLPELFLDFAESLPADLSLVVVVDCCGINFIDITATNMVAKLVSRKKNGVLFFFANAKTAIRRILLKAIEPEEPYLRLMMVPSIHEAVLLAKQCLDYVDLRQAERKAQEDQHHANELCGDEKSQNGNSKRPCSNSEPCLEIDTNIDNNDDDENDNDDECPSSPLTGNRGGTLKLVREPSEGLSLTQQKAQHKASRSNSNSVKRKNSKDDKRRE